MKKYGKNAIAGLSALLLLLGSAASYAEGLSNLKVQDRVATVQKAIAEKNAKWVAGETSLSGLSFKEQQRAVGLNFQMLDVPPLPDSKLTAKAPASIDWRNDGIVAKVKNQGQCGSCWAFALTAALESYVMRAPAQSKNVELSEQVMLSCSGVGSCNGGTLDGDFLQETGLPPASYFGYTQQDTPCGKAKEGWQKAAYKIGSWGSINRNLDKIKTALAQYGPLPTAMWVYEDLMHYKSGVYSYTSGKKLGGHAILLVGYNDAEQCFILKNSWGEGWGEKGFFKVAYSEINTVVTMGLMSIAYTSDPNDSVFPAGRLHLQEVDTTSPRLQNTQKSLSAS